MAQWGVPSFSAHLPTELWVLIDQCYNVWTPERYNMLAVCLQTRDAVEQNIAREFGFNAEQTKAFISCSFASLSS